MKFLTYLQEKYIATVTGQKMYDFMGGPTEVFVNPTYKEIRDAAEQGGEFKGLVRFIADYEVKDIYVFKADTFHSNVSDYLNRAGKMKGDNTSSCIWGVAIPFSGKLKFYDSDTAGNERQPVYKYRTEDNWTIKWFGVPLFQALDKHYGRDRKI